MTPASATPSPDPAAEPSFEDLYRELEAVTAELERGELPLARSLALYERGQELAAACRRLLDAAEQRVEELRATDDGGFER